MAAKPIKQTKPTLLILIGLILLMAVGLTVFISNSSEQTDNQPSIGQVEKLEELKTVTSGELMTGNNVGVQFTVPNGWKAYEDDYRIFLIPEDQGFYVDAGGVAQPINPAASPTIIVSLSTIDSQDQRLSSLPNPGSSKQPVLLGGTIPAVRSDLSNPTEATFQTVGDTTNQEIVITYKAPPGVDIKDNMLPLKTIEDTIIIV